MVGMVPSRLIVRSRRDMRLRGDMGRVSRTEGRKKMEEIELKRCERLFRDRVARCEGKLTECGNGLEFEGKNQTKIPFRLDCHFYEDYNGSEPQFKGKPFASLGCQYMTETEGYRGEGSPCLTYEEFEAGLEKLIKRYQIKSRDYEQLRLW